MKILTDVLTYGRNWYDKGPGSLIRDEQGSWSTARISFWIALLFTVGIITADVFGPFDVPNAAYAILTTIFMVTAGWAAGPRMMQYIAPQIGAATKAVADARAGLDNRYKDDERAE